MISINLHFNDTLKGRIAIEREINRLKDWASSNFIKFNKDKCNPWQIRLTKLAIGRARD